MAWYLVKHKDKFAYLNKIHSMDLAGVAMKRHAVTFLHNLSPVLTKVLHGFPHSLPSVCRSSVLKQVTATSFKIHTYSVFMITFASHLCFEVEPVSLNTLRNNTIL
jgi:hypothetical protein